MNDRPAHALTRPARIPGARTAAGERRDIPGARQAGPDTRRRRPAPRVGRGAHEPPALRGGRAHGPRALAGLRAHPARCDRRSRTGRRPHPAPPPQRRRCRHRAPRRRRRLLVLGARPPPVHPHRRSRARHTDSQLPPRPADADPGAPRRRPVLHEPGHPADARRRSPPRLRVRHRRRADGINQVPGRPKPAADKTAYSSARHQGLRQAYATLLGLDKFTDWQKGVATLRGDRRAEINTLANGGRRVELIFLNLADAHPRPLDGASPACGSDRALELRTVVADDSPVRKADAYDYDQLVDVLVGLMDRYRPTVVQTLDPDPDIQHSDEATRKKDSEQRGYSDHADHTAVACFSWAAHGALGRRGDRRTAGRCPRSWPPPSAATTTGTGPRTCPPPVAQAEGRASRPVRRRPLLGVRQRVRLRRLQRRRRPAPEEQEGLGPLHPPPLPRRAPRRRPDPDGRLAPTACSGCARSAGGRPGRAPASGAPRTTSAADRSRPRSARRRSPTAGSSCLRAALRRPRRPRRAEPPRGRPARTALPRRPVPRLARVSATPSGTTTAVAASASRWRSPPPTAGCISSYATRTRASARGCGPPTARWDRWRDLGGEEIQDGLSAVVDSRGRVHVFAAGRDGRPPLDAGRPRRGGGLPCGDGADSALAGRRRSPRCRPRAAAGSTLYYRRPPRRQVTAVRAGGAGARPPCGSTATAR